MVYCKFLSLSHAHTLMMITCHLRNTKRFIFSNPTACFPEYIVLGKSNSIILIIFRDVLCQHCLLQFEEYWPWTFVRITLTSKSFFLLNNMKYMHVPSCLSISIRQLSESNQECREVEMIWFVFWSHSLFYHCLKHYHELHVYLIMILYTYNYSPILIIFASTISGRN